MREKGFTLIELIITLAIMGIIAGIAIPAYRDYILKGKVQEATSGLADYRNKMEQFYQNNRTYQDVGGGCGALLAPKTMDYFTFSCASSDSEHYMLNAANKSGVGLDDGFNYTLDQSGNKTSIFAGISNNTCWLKTKFNC